jgi:hypothetical protein
MFQMNRLPAFKITERRIVIRPTCAMTITEFAAVLSMLVPLLIAILYVVLEGSYAYTIQTNLDSSARRAARALAINYGNNPTAAQASGGPNGYLAAFGKCCIPHFVQDVNTQFVSPPGYTNFFNTGTNPPQVSVTVTYPSAGIAPDMPPFPNPDVLHLGSNFKLQSTATYSVE